MDSCLILRATLFGILLLGLLTPAQTKAGYLGSVKKEYSQGMKRLGFLGSVKSEYNNQGMKKQAAPDGKDQDGKVGGGKEPKEDVDTLVTQANRQGRTGAKIGPGCLAQSGPPHHKRTSYF